ncbi:glycosylase [Streptomyces phage Stigma]|nr:glycosylase [Streptomyces phage Stigma]
MHVVPKFEGDHRFLSNFYHAPTRFVLADDIIVMPTGEHAFQAAKCNAMLDRSEKLEYVRRVATAETPGIAKQEGQRVKIDLDHWESVRVDCMREVVFQKFLQHPDLRTQLLKTGDAMLVEGNTWGDKFWGRVDGKGFNKLGVILMEVRGYWLWQTRRNSPEMGS